ncbi:MAG: hypothetical protein AVDCRST_MAG69-197, partial [uncultured Solirubrobacteraceae bacterium]
ERHGGTGSPGARGLDHQRRRRAAVGRGAAVVDAVARARARAAPDQPRRRRRLGGRSPAHPDPPARAPQRAAARALRPGMPLHRRQRRPPPRMGRGRLRGGPRPGPGLAGRALRAPAALHPADRPGTAARDRRRRRQPPRAGGGGAARDPAARSLGLRRSESRDGRPRPSDRVRPDRHRRARAAGAGRRRPADPRGAEHADLLRDPPPGPPPRGPDLRLPPRQGQRQGEMGRRRL